MTDIASALTELLNERETPLEVVVRRHFTDGYRQRTDGVWADRVGFLDHIAHLRRIIVEARVEVLDELREGSRYADRHIVRVRKHDGGLVTQEVYVFATLAADGRFEQLDETTLMLEGNEADRNLGNAR